MRSRREVLAGSALAGLSLALPRVGLASPAELTGHLEVVRVGRGRVKLRVWVTADQDLMVARTDAVHVESLRVDGQEQPVAWLPRDTPVHDADEVWMTRAGPRRRTELLASGEPADSWWIQVRAKPHAEIHVDALLQQETLGLAVLVTGAAPPRQDA